MPVLAIPTGTPYHHLEPPMYRTLLLVLPLTLLTGQLGHAQLLTSYRVASGLSRPIYATSPPGDTDRLFIVEQHTGRIEILDLDSRQLNPTAFLDIDGLATGSEQGLLGLAFHPDYSSNGYFYVNLTASGGTTVVRRYEVSANPDVADETTAHTIITYSQPFSNHNGGWIGFGPNDGYLYVNSGDGGDGNDPGNHAQTIEDDLLGKILRLDVDADEFDMDDNRNYAIPTSNPFAATAGDDEIWAYGLRNPWRASFDRENGDLWIGDVGQSAKEEIDYQPAGSSGGENYGWRVKEGTITTGLGGGSPPFVDPIYEYDNSEVGIAVTGGYVYRGTDIDGLAGTYFFGDYRGPHFTGGTLSSFRYDGNQLSEFTSRTDELEPAEGSLSKVVSFAEDTAGEIYVLDLDGDIFKILLLGDMDCDGNVDLDDVNPFLLGINDAVAYEADFGLPPKAKGDMDNDGDLDLDDVNGFVALLTGTGSGGAHNVPEPSAPLLWLTAVLCMIARRRRYSSSSRRLASTL